MLRQYGLTDLIWPSSHGYPVKFSQLLRKLPEVINTYKHDKVKVQKWVNELALQEKRQADQEPCLVVRPDMAFDILYAPKMLPHLRLVPYFYIYSTDNGSKIGSADQSQGRFSNTSTGIVIQLEFDPNYAIAAAYERNFALWLAGKDILPKAGKRDYFDMPIKAMIDLTLWFLVDSKDVKLACINKCFY